jgi:hypothetical protein
MEARFGRHPDQAGIAGPRDLPARSSLTIGPVGGADEAAADRTAEGVMRAREPAASGARVDFSRVRIHDNAQAARSARAVDARAYTVGQDIVFGAHQYHPATPAGRRLLAHELAHVLQQRRSPKQLQRTPAAPSYRGVTGVQDLSRIRIDAIPDFVGGGFTVAPRIINAYITEPSVVHMTWILYDPNDRSQGGFSTLPGQANATSRPFLLEWSTFAGAGFVAGKYVLRCIGLNAAHEPVVYADRDFNVLGADLTTGTALPTTYGELTFTTYKKTDASPPARPRYSVDVELRFLPKASVSCSQVGFIQSMQTIDFQGRSQQNTISSEQDARKTPLAWSIDRLAGGPTPFYGTERVTPTDPITIPPSSGAFGRGGPGPAAASLIDRPSWNRENVAKFESCAICRTGTNLGQVYGCATWGYTATASGAVTLMPRGFRQMPSDQFAEARAAWNTWRATRPAASRPEEIPALKSP